MESVERLNINTQNSDFRKNASSVIAAMLEARVNKSQPVLNKSQPVNNKSQPAMKSTQAVKSKRIADPDFLPPPPPLPMTKVPTTNIYDIEFTSCDQDLPLPPPPSPLKIPASILTPPLSSDENDLPQKANDNAVHNGVEKVNYRNKKHHSNGHNNQSSDSYNAPSTFSINKPELSTHARDRRSYIEKNNNEATPTTVVEEEEVDVAKIANGLANGEHPVCDKCKCKITRYVRMFSSAVCCWLLCWDAAVHLH